MTENESKEIERWYCETCEKHGAIEYYKHPGNVFEVYYNLGDDHRRISPACSGSTNRLRVLNEDYFKDKPLEEKREVFARFGLEVKL